MSDYLVKIGGVIGGCAGLAYLETVLTERFLSGTVASQETALAVPRLYGMVVLNSAATAFMMFALGMKVGRARKNFTDKATKDGDADAEARFSYPKMYAEGFGKLAHEFNCVQRGHQQALETYPQMLVLPLLGGLRHPIMAALGQVVWMVARWKWAEGYASGDPKLRYSSKWSMHIWTTMFLQIVLAGSTGLKLAQVL